MAPESQTFQASEVSPRAVLSTSHIPEYAKLIGEIARARLEEHYNVEDQMNHLNLPGINSDLKDIQSYAASMVRLLECVTMHELAKDESTELRQSLIHREINLLELRRRQKSDETEMKKDAKRQRDHFQRCRSKQQVAQLGVISAYGALNQARLQLNHLQVQGENDHLDRTELLKYRIGYEKVVEKVSSCGHFFSEEYVDKWAD
jgi:hypothetical protein